MVAMETSTLRALRLRVLWPTLMEPPLQRTTSSSATSAYWNSNKSVTTVGEKSLDDKALRHEDLV